MKIKSLKVVENVNLKVVEKEIVSLKRVENKYISN